MKKVFLLVLMVLPGLVLAQVDKFVFITDPQTILPSSISKSMTVQSQNTSGIAEDITETFDLDFKSTSQTGEFLNSSGNPVSTTMSKNTSNRTFYYKDSNLGEHTITVTFKGRDSQKSFSANQKISVSNTVSEPPSQASTKTTSQNDSSSSASLTTKDIDFDVSIGKDKFSSVNNDVVFQAVTKNIKDIQTQYIQYLWTLGDGTRQEGQIINHKYKYPGEYTVVLNASFADKYSSARLKVNIIEPIFEINIIPGAIELINKSDGEINLGDWIIVSGYQKFLIPKDTIVGKGKKIIFDRGIINISGQEIHLKDPAEKEIVFTNASSTSNQNIQFTVVDTNVKSLKTVESYKEIESTKKIVKKEKNNIEVSKVEENKEIKKTENIITTPEISNEVVFSDNKNDDIATVYVGKTKTNKLDSLMDLPIKGFKWLFNLFK